MIKHNWATYLTWLRVILIPVFVITFYLPFADAHLIAVVLFAIASFTDFLDGLLARKLDMQTKFGAFLDPVADKLIVAVVLIMIIAEPYGHWLVLPAIAIISREIIVSALREWMATIGESASVAVNWLGKLKTVVQMVALGFLLYVTPQSSIWYWYIGAILLYIAAGLTVWTMILYLKAAMMVDILDSDENISIDK